MHCIKPANEKPIFVDRGEALSTKYRECDGARRYQKWRSIAWNMLEIQNNQSETELGEIKHNINLRRNLAYNHILKTQIHRGNAKDNI